MKSSTSTAELHRLARWHGVATSYLDMTGSRRVASDESLLGVLQSLGVQVTGVKDAGEAMRDGRRARAHRVLEPVHVAWQGKPLSLAIQLPLDADPRTVRWECRLEQGTRLHGEFKPGRYAAQKVTRVDGQDFVMRKVPIHVALPVGYHELNVEYGEHRSGTVLFAAPEVCYGGRKGRPEWGMFAPLYALHSERSWGGGDLGDLRDFITWVREQGGRFVGTLPLLPANLPDEPSPYSPVTRLFWNEFYLDVSCLRGLDTSIAAQRMLRSKEVVAELGRLRRARLVDYAAQMRLKRRLLGLLAEAFFRGSTGQQKEFAKFLREHPGVLDYARFRAAQERRGISWREWPARMREGELREGDVRGAAYRYHLYVQWQAHEQMRGLSEHADKEGVALYLDMPLGTHRDGYDAWRYRDLFAADASGAAPPDPVFTQGQDWGFAPVHPERSREQGHKYMRAYLRHHLRHARMLRFDHVMGMHRLYWVPRGRPASQGAYVSYPADEYYAMLSIESHRHRAVIIGEDLGTVPPEVQKGMRRHGVKGMYVVQYELRPVRARPLRALPAPVVASLNTHDMPPFAGFWRGLDLLDHNRLGLIERDQLATAQRRRAKLCRGLMQWLKRGEGKAGRGGELPAVLAAVLRYLSASAAGWHLINLEDLWLEQEPQNTPGTTSERINWRRKTRYRLEEIREDKDLRELLGRVNAGSR